MGAHGAIWSDSYYRHGASPPSRCSVIIVAFMFPARATRTRVTHAANGIGGITVGISPPPESDGVTCALGESEFDTPSRPTTRRLAPSNGWVAIFLGLPLNREQPLNLSLETLDGLRIEDNIITQFRDATRRCGALLCILGVIGKLCSDVCHFTPPLIRSRWRPRSTRLTSP